MAFSRIAALVMALALIANQPALGQTTGFGQSGGTSPGPLKKIPTKAQITTVSIVGTGDVANGPFSEVTVTAPDLLTARADTNYEGATAIAWDLRAAGAAPDAVGLGGVIEATGSTFRLPLAQLLPPQPPAGGATYVLRARGLGPKSSTGAGSGFGTAGQGTAGRTPVGPWSAPALVHYLADTSAPVQFNETAGYHHLRIRLDRMNLINGQIEINKPEEFRIAGFATHFFIREVQAFEGPRLIIDKTAASRSFGPVSKDLDPPQHVIFNVALNPSTGLPEPHKEAILDFDLAPLSGFIGSRFFFAVSAIERDGGGEIQGWYDGLRAAQEILDESALDSRTPEQWGNFIAQRYEGLTAQIAQELVEGALTQTSPDPWSILWGTFRIVVTAGIAAVIEGEKDDFYGVKTIGLDLTSNLVTDIHALGGTISQKDGRQVFTMTPFKMRMLGAPAPMGASSWDGQIELIVSFEFSDLR